MNTTDRGSRGDFLSTVIDRAHGRSPAGTPLVAPRPASLFEPAADSAAEAIDAEAPALLPPASPHADAPPVHLATPPVAPPYAADGLRAASPPTPSAMTPPIALTQHFHMAAEPASPRAQQPAAIAPALALPVTVPRIARAPDGAAAPAPRTAHEAAPQPLRGEAVVPRSEVPAPRTAALLPDRDVVAAFAAQGPTPALAIPARDTASVAAPRPEPVVTISIGRVDVRVPAATPAATRAAAAQRPAGLSDYLGRKERAR